MSLLEEAARQKGVTAVLEDYLRELPRDERYSTAVIFGVCDWFGDPWNELVDAKELPMWQPFSDVVSHTGNLRAALANAWSTTQW